MATSGSTTTRSTGRAFGFPGSTSPSAWNRRRTAPVLSRNGSIATSHPLATAAGLRTLAEGGNAVDAAISAALADAVVLPAMCGLGGDLFAIVADASGATPTAFISSGIAPRGFSLDQARQMADPGGRTFAEFGPLSPSVPGFVSGLFSLLERYGSKPISDLARPAIGYAADGVPLSPNVVNSIANAAARLMPYDASRSIFLPGGAVPSVGAVLRQPDLARAIAAIAEGGPDVFYRGSLAREMTRALAELGGALTMDDFADHATSVEAPIATTYRGKTVYQTGLPTQGFLLLEALNIAANRDLGALGPSSAGGVHLLVESMKRAFADRWAYAGDPTVVPSRIDQLLSSTWATKRFATIGEQASTTVDPGPLVGGDTTYLCAADGNGLMISLIISLSEGFGSGVVAGDTGIVLNNRAGHCFNLIEGHPNCYAPGKKTMHTLNCWLIADEQGRPVVVGGTPGGDGQPQWNLQMTTGLIDAGLDVQAALEQPRWTIYPGSYPREVGHPYALQVEDRLGAEAIDDLRARGHNVVTSGDWGGLGSSQIIARDPDSGVLAGGSDPRSEGVVLGC